MSKQDLVLRVDVRKMEIHPRCILKYTQNTPFSQNTVYIPGMVYTLYKTLYTFDPS